MKEQGFEGTLRLKSNNEFKSVIARRNRVTDNLLTVYAAVNELGFARIGISVSRTYGSAVRRNRFKRFVREAFRLNREAIAAGWDYVVMPAKGQAGKLEFGAVEESLLKLTAEAAGKLRS